MSDDVKKLTHADIIRATKHFHGFREAKWTVIISGVEYPARPLVLEAAGVTPLDRTNSHQAVRKLKEFGFDVRYEGNSV